MAYRVKIDESSCVAQGDCMELAPAVFEVHDCAHVIGTGPDELLLQAAGSCPTEAIVLVDAESGEQVYP